MSKMFKVRAKSLDTAMRRAKTQFGPDAMVVDTRHLKVKDPERMGITTIVELTVTPGRSGYRGEPDAKLEGLSEVYEDNYPNQEYAQKLQGDIERIEKLIHSVTKTEQKLKHFDDTYPLGDILLNSGVTRGGLRVLQSSFEEKIPASERTNRREAVEHLREYLQCTKAESIADINGLHAFVGSGGSGKTSLIIRLATALAQQGKSVAIVVAAPFHNGDVKRVEAAASAIMIDAAVARDESDLARALQTYSDRDAVLIDTPCWMSPRGKSASAIFNALKVRTDVYKHYVCSLTNDFHFLLQELELYREWRCDFLALSRIDMVSKVGKFVDLALSRRVTFSFMSEAAADGDRVDVATSALLMEMVVPSATEGSERQVSAAGVQH